MAAAAAAAALLVVVAILFLSKNLQSGPLWVLIAPTKPDEQVVVMATFSVLKGWWNSRRRGRCRGSRHRYVVVALVSNIIGDASTAFAEGEAGVVVVGIPKVYHERSCRPASRPGHAHALIGPMCMRHCSCLSSPLLAAPSSVVPPYSLSCLYFSSRCPLNFPFPGGRSPGTHRT